MTKSELQQQVHDALSKLHAFRDEIRVRIHLGGMELKDKWKELEPHLAQVEQSAQHASDEALKALHELGAKFKDLSSRLANSEPLGGAKGPQTPA